MLTVLHDSPLLQSESEQHSTLFSTVHEVGAEVGSAVGTAEGLSSQSRPQAVFAPACRSVLQYSHAEK